MAVNRLFTKKKSSRPGKVAAHDSPQGIAKSGHEAVEVSLCDEGMCFCSHVEHTIGAVLLVDFEPEAITEESDCSLCTEAVVVDCRPSACGLAYDITVIFMGN